jgi:hypothetical protein
MEAIIMRQRQFSKSLSVALSQDQFEQIKLITDKKQISMAEWVRNVMAEKFDKIQLETINNEKN